MTTFTVSEDDRRILTAAIFDVIGYASEVEQQPYAELANKLESGSTDFENNPAEDVIKLGMQTWPARRAVSLFVENEGATDEWELVLKYARPTTVFLLKRLRRRLGELSLEDLLQHEWSTFALHGQERLELALLRAEIHQTFWRTQAQALQQFLTQAQSEHAELVRAMDERRTAGVLTPDDEWRVLIGGETMKV